MGRPKEDEFWNHVESVGGGLKCNFCNQFFKGKPSISRIKSHLSGESGRGIRSCERVPDDVKSKAYEAIQESNKRRKTMPSSSSNPSSRQQNDQVKIEPTPLEVQAPGHEVVPEMASSFPRAEVETFTANNAGETPNEAGDPRLHRIQQHLFSEESTEDEDTTIFWECTLRRANEGPTLDSTSTCHGVNENFTINNDREIGQDHTLDLISTSHGVNGNSTADNAAETRQDGGAETFPTTELVGQNFQINKEKVWECLMNDKISRIGICGMGGSGKTTLMKHIRNQLKENRLKVYWITISQDFGIHRLQTLIAKSIKLDLSTECEIIERAAKLWDALKKKQKCVLILDDLWDHFDLEDVGIPGDANGCKLVFTTRLLDVCRKMCCEEIIQVVPLNEDEAWRFFEEKFGHRFL